MTRFSGASQAEQVFASWEAERKTKRYNYWVMLKRARNDYTDLTSAASKQFTLTDSDFYYYMQRTFGVKVNLVNGNISDSYQIVDEKKHMLFLIKYAS